MKMKCIIKDNYETTNKICLVVERYVEIENTKVIYIGFDLEYQKINIDYNKTSKYLYRIRDLVKQLTNDVVQGMRKQENGIDTANNLNKSFRQISNFKTFF
ncbi:hypothetical protein NAPIS_ORF02608 [Vairimorpha apis BRL 01]|uniref:Uncharacterized protein n=1 Tax=Vairimorpha apis BRL 01 TaxID=1037528 RepID=T0KWI7_9MICR|nr:hypothetical protein NAPIS_ORF02608 [Vairimorpha apis BRL 01]